MKTYIYIACRGHSGSTLLEKLLATGPSVAALGEISHFSRYFDEPAKACSCGRTVRDCPFWNDVVKRLAFSPAIELDDVLPTDGYRSRNFWEDLPYLAALIAPDSVMNVLEHGLSDVALRNRRSVTNHWRIVDAASKVADSKIIVDKSMSASRLLEVARLAPSEYRVCAIHLVRDGRANAHSYREQFGLTIAAGARGWKRINTNIEHALRRLSNPRIRVRYEDLAADPGATLAQIAGAFDLTAEFDVSRISDATHAIGGNQAKLTAYENVRFDALWESSLDAADRAVFDRLAGALNHRYGYGGDREAQPGTRVHA